MKIDDALADFFRQWAIAAQLPITYVVPPWVMEEAALSCAMFIMWAWVDSASYDGRTFRYEVRLDGEIDHVTVEGTVSV